MIPFNKPFLTGKEAHYIYQAVNTGKLSGNGDFTHKCQSFFENKLLLSTKNRQAFFEIIEI